MVFKTKNNPFWVDMEQAAVEAAAKADVKLIVQAPERETDVEKQMQIVENMIQKRVDALVLGPCGGKEIGPAIKKANEAGIFVLIVDTRVAMPTLQAAGAHVETFIGSDNLKGGELAGEFLARALAGQGRVILLEGIAGHETVTLDYGAMPSATYCHPQVASFGLTEKQAREKGYEVKVAKFPFQANGKALGLGDYAGFVKIVSDARYGEILGAHLIGPEVTELLPELTLAHNMELTAEEIARNVHAHPSLSETLMEAAHGLTGGYIHI
ncbi:MAG: substrate-binding domain-containing protein [Chloroflexi bacterium]|nr:substrate-binding domain-containing protein [Chloroflexota bacterium]